MKSMTGYGYSEQRDDSLSLSVEMKSWNNRFLEIFVNLPPFLSSLEPRIREYLSERCSRGKIEAGIRLKEFSTDTKVSIDVGAAQAYYRAMEDLSETLGIKEKPSLSLILSMEGVIQADKIRDSERYWTLILPLLETAQRQFEADRVREGLHTENDILSHVGALEASIDAIGTFAPAMEASIKDNLRSRFAELLGDAVDESRLLSETAVLLMKYTISEELSRLSSHLGEFRAECRRNPAPGKKLDFLCQEINREVNTIGSKSPFLEVSKAVVAMKDALENIREQLRNVE